jgi:hypothetical protein
MVNIRVDSPIEIFDGQPLTFKSPVDCSQITGLKVYYPQGDTTTSKVFQFADAHGNNVGDIDLFASNVLVKVILDVDASKAYVQNADTNAYLEGRFDTKAPAGYGLGTIGKSLTESDDLNSVWACGFYWWSVAPANAPFTYGAMVVKSRSNDVFVQEITNLTPANSANAGTKVQRINYAGTITPDEWVNPPMKLGVEYRTTERYLDKPVYTMAIDCGILPNNTTTVIEHGIENILYVIEAKGNSSAGDSLPYSNLGYRIDVHGERNVVRLDSNYATPQTITATTILRYTKSTD